MPNYTKQYKSNAILKGLFHVLGCAVHWKHLLADPKAKYIVINLTRKGQKIMIRIVIIIDYWMSVHLPNSHGWRTPPPISVRNQPFRSSFMVWSTKPPFHNWVDILHLFRQPEWKMHRLSSYMVLYFYMLFYNGWKQHMSSGLVVNRNKWRLK